MNSPSIALTRALVGLAQGVVLYLLYRASEIKGWPATEPLVFAPLLVVAVFVPVAVIAGLGNLRARTLAVWAMLAAAVCAGLAVHDIFSDPLVIRGSTSQPRLAPTPALWPALAAVLFIVHSLIVSGEADRRFTASYSRLFDVSWKHGVQLALAASFVGAFWVLLWLSATLFKLIGISYVADVIKRPWFAAPATTVVFAYAVHATDARADLVRGVRTLALTLMAWLLPMMTVLATAFLVALPFTGLEPLWSTRHATATLLAAAAALILLINAAYQDGQDSIARLVRYSRSVAALVLVPVVALAAYGLMLRAQQYGWTPQRIVAGAIIVVASCYAVGYALAAFRPNFDLKGLEPTNIFAAFVVVAVVLALFSPVADPARIAVGDQLRRLETGQVTPGKFDYKFLRFRSGRYGTEALERLAAQTEGPQAAAISERAKQAMKLRKPWQRGPQSTPSQRAANISVVQPRGQTLPDSFLLHDWKTWQLPGCLTAADRRCQAVLVDLDADGTAEVLLFDVRRGRVLNAAAFKAGPDESWTRLGSVANVQCAGILDALEAGRLQAVEPQLKDIDANGMRLRVNTDRRRGCPP